MTPAGGSRTPGLALAARETGGLGPELPARGAERHLRHGRRRVLQQQPRAGAVPGRLGRLAGGDRPDPRHACRSVLPASVAGSQPPVAQVPQAAVLPHNVHHAEPGVPGDVARRPVRQRP